MRRPLRKYTFVLAERLGMLQRDLESSISCAELIEWLAFDTAMDPEFSKKYEMTLQREFSETQSAEERSAQVIRMLGGV